MAHYVLEDSKLWYGKRDLSGDVNQMNLTYEAEMQDDTTFESSGANEKLAGLKNVTMSHDGLWSSTADENLFDNIGSSNRVITIGPTDGSEGEPGFSFHSIQSNYSPGASVGDILGFSVEGEGDGELRRGTIIHTGTEGTSSGDGTAFNLGAATSSGLAQAALHVLSMSGSSATLDVTVDSDDSSGFASPITRLTFTQATTDSAEIQTATGPITDTWWRVSWTLANSTSAEFVVNAGTE